MYVCMKTAASQPQPLYTPQVWQKSLQRWNLKMQMLPIRHVVVVWILIFSANNLRCNSDNNEGEDVGNTSGTVAASISHLVSRILNLSFSTLKVMFVACSLQNDLHKLYSAFDTTIWNCVYSSILSELAEFSLHSFSVCLSPNNWSVICKFPSVSMWRKLLPQWAPQLTTTGTTVGFLEKLMGEILLHRWAAQLTTST